MSKLQKLISKLKSRPKDFTWNELCSLLIAMDYELINGSGSRRRFFNSNTKAVLILHEPHPRNYLLDYQVRDVLNHLTEKGLI